jgi:translation initiation factor 4G
MAEISKFYEYKNIYTEMPPELNKYVGYTAKIIHNYNNNNKYIAPIKKKHQPLVKNEDKLMANYRSILNKLSDNNIELLTNEIILLKIDTKEKMQKLIDCIFNKAINDSKFRKNYAIMCKLLSGLSVLDNDKKILFIELLLNRAQYMFNEAINISEDLDKSNNFDNLVSSNKIYKFKEQVSGCVEFIGYLYLNDLITIKILQACFMLIFDRINQKKLYTVDNLAVLFKIVSDKLHKISIDAYTYLFGRIQKLKDNNDLIGLKERFMLMDLIDYLEKKY